MHFTLSLFLISIDPYICFGLCKNHHQGVLCIYYIYILHIFTSNGISVLIVMQYLSVQLPFTYKISLKSVEVYWNKKVVKWSAFRRWFINSELWNMHGETNIKFLHLFLYNIGHNRIQLNCIQYECTCTFTHFATTEDYQHTGMFNLEYTLLHIYIYITTILVAFSIYFHPLRPPFLFVPRNETAFIVRESCFHHVFPGSIRKDGTAT
jgi:hypothetical protein